MLDHQIRPRHLRHLKVCGLSQQRHYHNKVPTRSKEKTQGDSSCIGQLLGGLIRGMSIPRLFIDVSLSAYRALPSFRFSSIPDFPLFCPFMLHFFVHITSLLRLNLTREISVVSIPGTKTRTKIKIHIAFGLLLLLASSSVLHDRLTPRKHHVFLEASRLRT